MKKVLVIHPKDETTDFLCEVYHKDMTIIRSNLGDSLLQKLIRQHDVIVMMGHGDSYGLFGYGRYIIDSSFVQSLRDKQCIFIWCYASDFIKRYNLKTPISTGMFISELEEAQLCNVNTTLGQITTSNNRFAKSLYRYFTQLYKNEQRFQNLVMDYKKDGNPVVEFNTNLFYSNTPQ